VTGITTKTRCQRSIARHYKMSLERRATCAAHPSYCSTVLTYKLTKVIETEHMHIC